MSIFKQNKGRAYLICRNHKKYSLLVVRVVVNRKKIELSTGYHWPSEYFCKETNFPVPQPETIPQEFAKMVLALQKALTEIEDLIKSGRTFDEIKVYLKNGNKSLFSYMEQALAEDNSIAESTRKQYKSSLKSIKLLMPDVLISNINERYVQKLVALLGENSPSTVRNKLNVFKKYVKKALRDSGIYKPYLFTSVTMPKSNPKPKRVISTQEAETLWAAWQDEEGYSLSKAERKALRTILMQCYTGLRASDILAMTQEDIERGKIKMKKTEREVPLVASARLKELSKADDLPIGMAYHHYNYALAKLSDSLGVEKIVSHAGRRFFATQLNLITDNIYHVQQALGHSSIGMTSTYIQPSIKIIRQLVEQLGAMDENPSKNKC